MIMISMAYPVAALFPLVFSLRLLDGLPLHIRWRIRATALERYKYGQRRGPATHSGERFSA